MNEISKLQNWFQQKSDGKWEHQYGIAIASIDNPGWSVKIDLAQTHLGNKPFNAFSKDDSNDNWITCRVNDQTFEGYGDVSKLAMLLKVFFSWAESFPS